MPTWATARSTRRGRRVAAASNDSTSSAARSNAAAGGCCDVGVSGVGGGTGHTPIILRRSDRNSPPAGDPRLFFLPDALGHRRMSSPRRGSRSFNAVRRAVRLRGFRWLGVPCPRGWRACPHPSPEFWSKVRVWTAGIQAVARDTTRRWRGRAGCEAAVEPAFLGASDQRLWVAPDPNHAVSS